MDDFWDVVFSTLFAGLVGFLVIFSILQIVEASSHDSCHEKGELLQVKVTYRKWDGCYVKQDNLWVPFDTWKFNRDHGIMVK